MKPSDLRVKSNRWLRRIIAQRPPGRVLNVGCGSDEDFEGGHYSDWFVPDEVVNVDIEPNQGVDIVANSEQLPFPDSYFSSVFANWMLYKTDEPRTLRELRRVAQIGATIFLSYSGASDSKDISRLRQLAADNIDIEEVVTIPYRAPRDCTPRVADVLYGRMRDVPVLTTPTDPGGESFVVRLVEPVLLVVAHWDDEVVSAGGTLSRYGRDWDVVCVTRREHVAGFENAFKAVCEECQARAVTLDIPHRTTAYRGESIGEFYHNTRRTRITPQILKAAMDAEGIRLDQYGTVITHHFDGDIGGHPHHRQIARACKRLMFDGNLMMFAPRHGDLLTPDVGAQRERLLRHYYHSAVEMGLTGWSPVVGPLPQSERFVQYPVGKSIFQSISTITRHLRETFSH